LQIRIQVSRLWRERGDVSNATGDASVDADSQPSLSQPASGSGSGAAFRVALGILISRVTGLIRERVIAHYFGNSAVADAFRAAIRIPNLLNNLFGEGVLSASFITVYAKLRARKDDQAAEHVAAAVFGLLALVCAVLVLAGVLFTPILIDLIAPGFSGAKRQLTIQMVRILFPGTGLLVMSAWCLGVLNSHRRFLLSYTSPVGLNMIMIAALLSLGGHTPQDRLAIDLAWASVAGSGLQFLVQLPTVLRYLPHFRPLLDVRSEHVRTVIKNFGPTFVSRGIVQISAYIDSIIASLLPTGAVAALGYGQIISVLPVSLFSMSVSAAELPALSSALGTDEEIFSFLRNRLRSGLRRIAYLVIPSAVAFLVLGDVVAGTLYQSGRFSRADTVYVWAVLAGSSVGLLATCLGRLYSSAFYALYDTKTPLRFAAVRVLLTTALGFAFALWLPGILHLDPKWGVAGLTSSAGLAGWVEFSLLRRALGNRIGRVALSVDFLLKLWLTSLVTAGLAYSLKQVIGTSHPVWLGIVVLGFYCVLYGASTYAWGINEAQQLINRVLRYLGRT
jgi:putative peptidoglycan lipid II flippase